MKKLVIAASVLAFISGIAYYMYMKTRSNAETDDIDESESNEKLLFCKCDTTTIGIDLNDKNRNKNSIIIGQAGSGKSYSFILSNLLNGKISAICVDPRNALRRDYEKLCKEPKIRKTVDELCAEPGVLFLSGEDATTHNVSELYNEIMSKENRRAIVFFIDDYPELRHIPGFEAMLAAADKNKIYFEIVVQTLAQLRAGNPYWQIVMSKCDNILMLSTNNDTDIDAINEMRNLHITNVRQDECVFISKNTMLCANKIDAKSM